MSARESDAAASKAAAALCLLAACLSAASLFMPTLYSEFLAQIRNNRLVEHPGGWAVLGCAALLIISAYRLHRGLGASWLAGLSGLAMVGLFIYQATGARLIVEKGGALEGPTRGTVGLGLLLTGLSGLIAIAAGLIAGYFAAPRPARS